MPFSWKRMECKWKLTFSLPPIMGKNICRSRLNFLFNQTYRTIKCIVRDDCSQDSTVEISKKNRVEIHCGNKNAGVVQNFSELMRLSQNDYIMFCDQDDVWAEDKVEKCLQRMLLMEQKYGKKTPLLVHTDLCVVDEKLNEIAPSFWSLIHVMNQSSHQLNRMLVQNVVTGCAMMMNRAVLEMAYPIPPGVVMHDSGGLRLLLQPLAKSSLLLSQLFITGSMERIK